MDRQTAGTATTAYHEDSALPLPTPQLEAPSSADLCYGCVDWYNYE